jgi:hypothetical protein
LNQRAKQLEFPQRCEIVRASALKLFPGLCNLFFNFWGNCSMKTKLVLSAFAVALALAACAKKEEAAPAEAAPAAAPAEAAPAAPAEAAPAAEAAAPAAEAPAAPAEAPK